MSKTLFTRNSYTQEERDQFEQALLNYDTRNSSFELKVGQKLSGSILSKSDKEARMYAYGKCDITIPMNSFEKKWLDQAEVGTKVAVIITEINDVSEGFSVIGSIAENYAKDIEAYLDYSIEHQLVMTCIPLDMNHAGYSVKININGDDTVLFMPHLLTSVNKLSNPESIIGQEMEVILDVMIKERQKFYVASHKKFLETLVPEETSKLSKGQACNGVITGFREFGVFVQFNKCLTGMIHKSNLDDETLSKLENSSLVNGEQIQFYIKDFVKGNIYLTQILRESIWDTVQVGQHLTGKVSDVRDFGVMVQLDYETRGLLHMSVLKSSIESYKKGDTMHVYVTKIDKQKRQITLNQEN